MRALSLLLLLFYIGSARAETPSQIPNPLQTRRSWVADSAGVVSADEERRINAILSPLERKNGAEVAVVTVHNLGGQSVEDFANELFRLWKIGKKGRDNGVVILVAVDDRKSRIDVDYGLQDTLTDGQAGEILRQEMRPQFKAGAYGEGLVRGATAVARKIDPSIVPSSSGSTSSRPSSPPGSSRPPLSNSFPQSGVPVPQTPRPAPSSSSSGGIADFFIVVVGLLIFLAPALLICGLIWWLIKWVTRPKKCPRCQTVMVQLPDNQETRSLSAVQQFEQQIKARDYKVWQCPQCGTQDITWQNEFFSSYGDCPACGHRTAKTMTKVIQRATQWQEGVEQITTACQWPECRHQDVQNRTLPRLPDSSAVTTGAVLGSTLGNASSDWGSSSNSNDSGWSSSSSSSSSDSSPSFDSGPSDFGGSDSGGGGGGASDSW